MTVLMISGFGQFHSNEIDPSKPGKILKPYKTISFAEIRSLVDKPQQLEKDKAQWFIPSTLLSRSFKNQEQQGLFFALWADLDKNPPDLLSLADIVEELNGGADFELYNSRSATQDNQKARGLIFLDKPLCFADWNLLQQILNDKFEALGIIPDRANERAAQLCYLPNRGALYSSVPKREGRYFDPLQFWQSEIAVKREKLEADRLELEAAKQQTMAKRADIKLSDSPDLIGAFNLAYTPQEFLLALGYEQPGDKFRQPHSESGSFSTSIKDGRVHALSPNDLLYTGLGGGAHDAFSTFVALKHGGDTNAALKDAGDNYLMIDGESYNRVKRREYAKGKKANAPIQEQFTPPQKNSIPFNVPSIPGTDARDGTHTKRPLSELGNALRINDRHADKLKYVPEAKAFLHWSDAWLWDVDGALTRSLAAELPQRIYAEGAGFLDDAENFAKWARMSQKERTIKSTIALLQDIDQVRVNLSHIDCDNWLVGFNNAQRVIDLRTGIDRPAQQTDLVTKSLNIAGLEKSSKAQRWRAFLEQIFESDTELIDWLQRWCGYLLTGDTSEQIFLFCFGLGANGISVLADTLRYILGDYARAIASETLTETKRQAGCAVPDLAALVGARLALSSETEDGAALAESLVKGLVSGDAITVRGVYRDPFQMTPRFKLMMLGNHKPIIKGADYGIWRRVRMLPFVRTFKPEERDKSLLTKLKAEAPHICAWMVEGCLNWQKRGLDDVPAKMVVAAGDYREEQDLLGRWLSECCHQAGNLETPTKIVYANYTQWSSDNGLRPLSSIGFGRKLSEKPNIS